MAQAVVMRESLIPLPQCNPHQARVNSGLTQPKESVLELLGLPCGEHLPETQAISEEGQVEQK